MGGGDNLVGTHVGRFRVLGKLGAGGMGVVYEAEDERLGRRVALKVLQRGDDPEARARFVREARSASQVAHPHAAVVYEAGEDGDIAYLAMELVQGVTLDAWLEVARPLRERLRVAGEVAAAVAKAHELGIVHRDLKPGNVMIARDGAAKVLDFGLAKQQAASLDPEGATTATATLEGRLVGTPGYMSPEQVRGKSVDARSDVFSLGVVLYEMFGGRRPFAGVSSAELLAAILRDKPEPLRSLAPDVPEEIERLVDRCLAKAPGDRWPSARELLEALESVRPGGAPAPDAPRSRAGLVAALLVAVGAVAAVVLLAGPRKLDVAPGAVPPASAASSSTVRAITEWPPPPTSSPEAATLYAEGLLALRHASFELLKTDLMRAVELDPHFAAAHVRLAIIAYGEEEARIHIAAAAQASAPLSDRDERILALAKANHLDPARAPVEGPIEARRLADALPRDPEALFWAAATLKWEQPGEALPLIDRALQLDPNFAVAEYMREEIADFDGDLDAMLASDERCTAIQPAATVCILGKARVHGVRGECADMERYARQAIAVEPSSGWGYAYLIDALGAQGAPPDALQQLAGKASLFDPIRKRQSVDTLAAYVGLYSGDLDAAEASLLALRKDQDAETVEEKHVSDSLLIDLYDEEGETEKGVAIAQEYLRRMPAWDHARVPPGRVPALAALVRAGRESPARADALRAAWLAEWKPDRGRFANDLWFDLYASSARTPAEAREALAALPSFTPLRPLGARPWLQGDEGTVHALAGDAERAIPELRAAVTSCFGPRGLLARMRQRLLLGQMLERRSDRDGACEQYAAVLARWGHAKPRSVTANKARARSEALGCQ